MRALGVRAASAVAVLVATPMTVIAVNESAQAAPKTYSSCTKLHKDFKYGVAKSKKAAKKQVSQGNAMPAYSDRAQKVYWANDTNLDRDHDGTACETA
ncbi:excalibur calcium-binding domain-containing protein [Nocardioides sp. STR2]|uniref:Excalibur calcium-binding domain-containing protein n=1 Tax=Nocardioides pini TaxID=2975053 RepID=A0ABT4CBA8_9ACTN|nr:excalibur calcium-binding domain-containing protein [Nocardioides pini]MCY4725394.1 excalibur calcium-binding domain-containing protein [Nocardioides pini]